MFGVDNVTIVRRAVEIIFYLSLRLQNPCSKELLSLNTVNTLETHMARTHDITLGEINVNGTGVHLLCILLQQQFFFFKLGKFLDLSKIRTGLTS